MSKNLRKKYIKHSASKVLKPCYSIIVVLKSKQNFIIYPCFKLWVNYSQNIILILK
jgi:hypothetical protein